MDDYNGEKAELSLSLDVIYHLIENEVFDHYMRNLFGAARCYVIIYSSNLDEERGNSLNHIRHRKFTNWINENISGWKIKNIIPNKYPYKGDYKRGSLADFYIYEKIAEKA